MPEENPNTPASPKRVIVIGGGAAGFFGAIACAEVGGREVDVEIFERGPEVLQKVRISGGGRCNVTHACDDPRALSEHYPRGGRSLIGLFHRWGTADTVRWFEEHGVEMKTEGDGRMFPVTDDSQTVVECLKDTARDVGVRWRIGVGVEALRAIAQNRFEVTLTNGESIDAQAVLVATGGTRSGAARLPAEETDHALEPPVPSLFTFKIDHPLLAELQGLSVPGARVTHTATKFSTSGPVLITHWGLSGPAVLKLSAWQARVCAEAGYRYEVTVNWLGSASADEVAGTFRNQRESHGNRSVAKRSPFSDIPKRLWARMVDLAGIPDGATWSTLTKRQSNALIASVARSVFDVDGKSMNKEEFVTCGGVRLRDVDLKTMQSRSCPGLYFAGEVLDIDGVTGGFNFQSAWATGKVAGEAMGA